MHTLRHFAGFGMRIARLGDLAVFDAPFVHYARCGRLSRLSIFGLVVRWRQS